MSGNIKISPKHGLNPCILVCAFCGKEKDEIAIMGRLKGDAKAPRHAVVNYEPCDKCLENWSKGVVLIRVTKTAPIEDMVPCAERDGMPLFITGQYSVITCDAAKRIFNTDMDKGEKVLLEDKGFDLLMERLGV